VVSNIPAIGAAEADETAISSNALARFAVAQQDISGAQFCAPEIVAVLRRPSVARTPLALSFHQGE
jgi:hypothetical protein